MRIDRRRIDELARLIDHRDLDASTEARVEAHGDARSGRRREQQILHVAREDHDCRRLSPLSEAHHEIDFEADREFALPREANAFDEPGICGPATIGDVECGTDTELGGMGLAGLVRNVEGEIENALIATTQHGERAVRGDILDALAEVEVVRELRAFRVLAFEHLGGENALLPQPFAQVADELRILANALDDDVAGAVERGLDVGDALLGIDEFFGFLLGHERRIFEKEIAEGFEAGLTCDLRFGAPLGLVRRVQILELDLGASGIDRAGEVGRELALLLDAFQDTGAAQFELAQICEAHFQRSQLRIIEAPRLFLAVAGDERNGRAFVHERNRRGDLPCGDTKLRRDAPIDLIHLSPRLSMIRR